MVPVLREVTDTLRGGHRVWLVQSIPLMRPQASSSPSRHRLHPCHRKCRPSGGWGLIYIGGTSKPRRFCSSKLYTNEVQIIPAPGPVNSLEDVSVVKFSGYRPGAE